MITSICDHYVDPSTMKLGGWVLDLGCAGFQGVEYYLSQGFKVIGLEPARFHTSCTPSQRLLDHKNYIHSSKACVGIKTEEMMTFYEYAWGGANSLILKPEMLNQEKYEGHGKNPFLTSYEVCVTTITEIMDENDIQEFEYIKMDIEGAEYDIVENLPTGIKQLSIEFHDFLDLCPDQDTDKYHENLSNNILINYKRVVAFGTPTDSRTLIEKGGWKNNVDDCLYIRKDLL